jgi:hypothetical protein
MTTSTRIVFASLAVALAVTALLIRESANPAENSPGKLRAAFRMEAIPVRTGAGPVSGKVTALREGGPLAQNTGPWSAMSPDSAALNAAMIRYRFETSLDYRALFDELMRSGDAEGKFFAAKMLSNCADVGAKSLDEVMSEFVASIPPDAPFAAERVAAFRQIKEPCAGFSGRKPDADEIERLLEDGARSGDPRARSWMLARNTLDSSADTMAVAARLLESGDPYALNNVANFLFRANRPAIMVDGALVDAADLDAAQMAWDLVACDHGWPCGRDSEPMLSMCARDGLCAAQTFEELIRTELGILASFERVQAFRARILAALARKDFSSLGVVSEKPGG